MIVPAIITTPDGVERSLRFTLGARRRIARDLGRSFAEVMQGLSDEDLPTLLYHLLFDEDGNPPAGLSIAKLEESYEPGDTKELLATLLSAMSQGSVKKNEAMEMIEAGQRSMTMDTGLTSGASPVSISESADRPRLARSSQANSGNSRRRNSPRLVTPMPTVSAQSSPA
jgi:hypothetical protein